MRFRGRHLAPQANGVTVRAPLLTEARQLGVAFLLMKLWPFKRKRAAPAAVSAARWRAVAIAPGQARCAAVARYAGRRLLVNNAPALPVPGCDEQSCQCSYQRFADRRDEPRRDIDVGIGTQHYIGSDRRVGRTDRRASEKPTANRKGRESG